ncbi:MAG: hypothetical protein E6G29_02885 [Actinobacteria bacterium]|nr:MAG: hypothetical protein E6G29_02885 [Actinomycetota bacterium]
MLAEHDHDLLRTRPVEVEVGRDEHGLGAQPPGALGRRRGEDPVPTRLVARGGHHRARPGPGHHNRQAAELRTPLELDAHVEGVHVDVGDHPPLHCRDATEATGQPAPPAPSNRIPDLGSGLFDVSTGSTQERGAPSRREELSGRRGRRLAASVLSIGTAGAVLIGGVAIGDQARPAAAKRRPDLVERSVSHAPDVVRPGGALHIRDRALNKGRARAGSFTVGFYLTRELPVGRTRIGGRKVSSLARGKSSSATTTVRLPTNLASASYRLAACADDRDHVKERHEHNNCRVASSTIRVLARERTPPTSRASAPTLTNSTSIRIDYTADGTGSPLDRVELYLKAPGHTDFSKTATYASPATTGGHFDYTATAGDGDYAFYTVAYDKARNVEAPPGAPDATTTLDTAAPTSSASGATAIDASSIQVDYTADGTGSALDKVQLYAQAPGETGFSKVATDSSPAATGGHFDYTATAGDGDYAFYTVAYDKAGNVEAAPGSPDETTTLTTLLAAGDIAGDPTTGGTGADTAALIQQRAGQVVTLGDNTYENGTLTEFNSWYDPTWGAFKSRTKPSAGNREYNTSGAAGYFGYFGAAAGDSTKGYYSYDLGAWHIVALNSNSNCSSISCAGGSDQETWLRADLAQHTHDCILAYWHHPLYSSSQTDSEGDIVQDGAVRPLFKALYDYHADIVLNGHQHNYERFAQQDSTGNAGPNGIREFVVGTGGRSHKAFPSAARAPNSEAGDDQTFGVLELTLASSSYSWQFIPVAGETFIDQSSGPVRCHNRP